MQGAVSALLGSKQTVRVDLTFELGEKGSLSLERRLLGAMLGVHGIGGSASTKGTLARRHLLTGGSSVKQRWITALFAHRKGVLSSSPMRSAVVLRPGGVGASPGPSLEHANRTI
jgi:hypothetical protein